MAASNDHTNVIEQLIALGCSVPSNIVNYPTIKKAQQNQQSLLKELGRKNSSAIIKLLRDKAYANATVKKYLFAKINELFEAVAKDNSSAVKQFLKMGFSLNITDEAGNTLLHKAFYHKSRKVLELLFWYIPGGTDNLGAKNKQGLTPIELTIATSSDYAEFLHDILANLGKGPQQIQAAQSAKSSCSIQ